VRAVNGDTPEVMISNIANPSTASQDTLERYMGREMRSRYLNPQWIEAMQQEGYAGAKMINQVVGNMWGWQVTVPEAVDAAKWNEMYATYVQDRHDLGMEEFFREAGNLWAYQALMTRMLEAVRKGYWDADAEVVADLGQRVSELIDELQLQCSAEDCHDPILTKLVQANLVPAPMVAMVQAPAPAAAPTPDAPSPNADAAPTETVELEQVQGYAMEEVVQQKMVEFESTTRWIQIAGFLLLCLALVWGFRRPSTRWSSA
jgi:cobaltochelatase CobN